MLRDEFQKQAISFKPGKPENVKGKQKAKNQSQPKSEASEGAKEVAEGADEPGLLSKAKDAVVGGAKYIDDKALSLGGALKNMAGFPGAGGNAASRALGYGVPAAGAAGLYGLYRMLSGGNGEGEPAGEGEEMAEDPKTAAYVAQGTPFMDGFLLRCAEFNLDGNGVADMLEKGAELEGPIGDEIRGFVERLINVGNEAK